MTWLLLAAVKPSTRELHAFAFPLFSHRQDSGEDSRGALFALLSIVAAAAAAIVGMYFLAPTILVNAIFGSEYAAAATFVPWMAIAFVCVTVFLVGFRIVAVLAFPMLAVSAWLIVRKHPKMFQLWGLSLSQRSYYDPRKD